MATPTQISQHQTDKPTDESTKEAAGVNVTYRVQLVLNGTSANVAADWATLVGTNFASPSALISWDRA